MTDQLNYPVLIDNAMRGMVRDVLRLAEKKGLPGQHHFYVTFRTEFPGSSISPALKARYPEEMTIVLQHQFWDFKVEETFFTVTLSFSGVPEKLVVPFAAVTAFADPSVKFGLQFQHLSLDEAEAAGFLPAGFAKTLAEAAEDESGEPKQAEIISLDAFRKK